MKIGKKASARDGRRRTAGCRNEAAMAAVLMTALMLGAILPGALPVGGTVIEKTDQGAATVDVVFPAGGGSKGAGNYSVPFGAYLLMANLKLTGKPGPYTGYASWEGKTDFKKGTMSNISSVYETLFLESVLKNWTSPEGFMGADLTNIKVREKYALLAKLEGTFFMPGVKIDANGLGGLDLCDIAIDINGTLHLIFIENLMTPQLRYMQSSDGGLTWTDKASFQAMGILYPHIYVGPNGYIHIFYNNIMMGGSPLMYQRSKDNGTTFESIVWSFRPMDARVAFDYDGTMHFAGIEAQAYPPFEIRVYYWNSTDNGTTQSPQVQVSDDDGNISFKEGTAIALDSFGKVHIVWFDTRNTLNGDDGEIYYSGSKYHDVFSPNIKVEKLGGVVCGMPELALDSSDTLHVVWADNRNGDFDIIYASSNDGGNSFARGTVLNTITDGDQMNPAISVGFDDRIHVVWGYSMDSLDAAVTYVVSDDGGATFSDDLEIEPMVDVSQMYPRIVTGLDSAPKIVWSDSRDGYDIFFTTTYVPFVPKGDISGIADLGLVPSKLLRIFSEAMVADRTAVNLSIRTSADNVTWSDWEDCFLDDSNFDSAPGRYINWRLVLVSEDGSQTPEVGSLLIEFEHYKSAGVWTSDTVSTAHNVTDATLSWNATNDDLLGISVSNDDGKTWTAAAKGAKVAFAASGSRLKVMADFSSASDRSADLSNISMAYSSVVYPTDLKLDIEMYTGQVWNMSGELSGPVTVNITKALGAYLKAYNGGSAMVPLRLRLTSGSAGTVVVSDISFAVDLPPQVTGWTPQGEAQTIEEGKNMTFGIVAADPDGVALTYKWFLDGIEVQGASGPNYLYEAPMLGNATHSLRVMASDARFAQNKSWTIKVVDINRPPIIDNVDPAVWDLELLKGTATTFKVTAHDPDNDAISYTWTVDNTVVPQATGPNWTVNYGMLPLGKVHKLYVTLSDGTFTVERSWNITVKSGAKPQITDWTPKTNISITKGKSTDLGIVASHPDGLALNYTWYVNGQKVAQAGSKDLKFKGETAGTFKVKVVVSDGNNAAEHEWTVVVKKGSSGQGGMNMMVIGIVAAVLIAVGAVCAAVVLRRSRK